MSCIPPLHKSRREKPHETPSENYSKRNPSPSRPVIMVYDRYDKSPLMQDAEKDDDGDMIMFGETSRVSELAAAASVPAAAIISSTMSDSEIEARAFHEKTAANSRGANMIMNAREKMKNIFQRMQDAREFRKNRPRLVTRTLASLDYEYEVGIRFQIDENAFKSLEDEEYIYDEEV